MPGLVLAERLKKEPVATCLVGMLEEFSENNKCFGKMSILFSLVVSYSFPWWYHIPTQELNYTMK